jgi:cytochrome c oxidase assembly protein subunit 15
MKKLVLISILLAAVVIVLGTYVRLTDAGLGCPDWPGCYGHINFAKPLENIEIAQQSFSDLRFGVHKTRSETVHRYFAAALGFFIFVIFINSLFNKAYNKPIKLPLLLLLLVCFQGALGMWTVTLNLLPAVVMSHLLGGFSVLCGLYLLYLRLTPYRIPGGDVGMRRFGKYSILGMIILTCQIALGGWTSANYAALACTSLPICEGIWYERLDFWGAFNVPDAANYELEAHHYDALITLHVVHRIGALITFLYLCWLGIRLYAVASSNFIKKLSALMVSVLGIQIILGVSNVVYSLPIAIAVMHNIVAACLMLVLIKISYTLYRKT